MPEKRFIQINSADNNATALEDMVPGDVLSSIGVTIQDPIPMGHKFALKPIQKGDIVRRYGQVIADATADIAPGSHVHQHNLQADNVPATEDMIGENATPTPKIDEIITFDGYKRADGRVATRNCIAIISTVNCSATVCRAIADHYRGAAMAQWPNVDGVVALTHSSGCCIAPGGEGMKILRRTLGGYARHANFAGVLMIGLGCEVNTMKGLLEQENLAPSDNFVVGSIQELGGTRKTIKWGIEHVGRMLDHANSFVRTPQSAEHLIMGSQCGGSDAFSGISANPAIGKVIDKLAGIGATGVLAETVELHGADQILVKRARTREIGLKMMFELNDWRERVIRDIGQVLNLSDGNIAGGLSTSPEKSMGSFAKGGSTDVVQVCEYAEPITEKGLVYMSSPAYDPSGNTGQIAGGANVLVFSTGRGSAYGSAGAPCLKISSNTALFERQEDDIDFNAGSILDGDETLEEAGERLFQLVIETASGRQTKSEEMGVGENEFIPWVPGGMV